MERFWPALCTRHRPLSKRAFAQPFAFDHNANCVVLMRKLAKTGYTNGDSSLCLRRTCPPFTRLRRGGGRRVAQNILIFCLPFAKIQIIIFVVAQGINNRGSTLDIRLSGSTVLSGSTSKDSVEAFVETMESADMKYTQIKLK
jgi:hypothetical protein